MNFVVEKEHIKIIPQKSAVLSTAGIFKTKKPALSAKKLRRLTEEDMSEE